MQRFDRLLGILLYLRSGQSITASELAEHFEVSTRTVYRDLDTLSLLGIPLYAERGREGGFQLLEGYFLPPLMFSQSEAVAVLLGLSLQKKLRATPFQAEMQMAEKKLLAAFPERLRTILARMENLIGIEKLPADIFHPETNSSAGQIITEDSETRESDAISTFFQALLDGKQIAFEYSAYRRDQSYEVRATPSGLLWDRDHWYLVGIRNGRTEPYMWRSDRVVSIRAIRDSTSPQSSIDMRDLLERQWLKSAIAEWSQQAPVKIRLTLDQARRLQGDWYYRHARFEPLEDEAILMTFGESNPAIVMEFLRWLGPDAELIEPISWRAKIREELQHMLTKYTADTPD